MKSFLSILLTLLCALFALTACTPQPAPTDAPTESATENPTAAPTEASAWDEVICTDFDAILTDTKFTGAVCASYQGRDFYTFGNGKTDKSADIPNSPDTVFCAASLTKQFTAAAILRLCEEGKLSLSDTLGTYFPDYTAGADITVHHLLSMQSGIEDYTRLYDSGGTEIGTKESSDIPGLSPDNTARENRTAIERFILSRPLLFTPGERYGYSNSNYLLLGGIIEQVSAEDFHDYIRDAFFLPLNLDSAGFADDYDNPNAVAKANHPEGRVQYMSYPGGAFACGDMLISPRDMCRWTEALHSGEVLSKEMYALMTTVHAEFEAVDPTLRQDGHIKIGYGYGIQTLSRLGYDLYYHEGHIDSYTSFALGIPDLGFTLVLMSNYARDNIEEVATSMLQAYLTSYTAASQQTYPYSPTLSNLSE